ncbi:helix-turn-helix transcriptional regulator [Mycolicibacterium arseniciresistens]|uniref:Helix-turn-helix transcriptional regulator n=1 Tax=Mycolicibacterium arseniciresistens TaxID=3062257 RepID=A0ABT8UDV1_9MYCO|nr:helix-turn-helix transcriptional regulator [Mycolicibacterium arseniciresistens]MDO3635351.1 helix-turn-helix transcriptional regulator [Mycolicibacterium arseniciresistens]
MTWSGAAVIEPGRLIYSGRLGAAHGHSHAAVQIAVASDEPVLFTDTSGRSVHARAGIIPSGITHSVDAGAATGIMMYLDPTSARGRRVEALVDRDAKADVSAWVAAAQRLPAAPPLSEDLSAAADAVLANLLGPDDLIATRAETHPAVAAAVALLPDLLGGPVRLTDVASAVHLSADRLGRLFARDVGLSFPAYVRWARLIRAIEVARIGGTITDVAHAAGFTDSSHANRAFHEMFGVAPIDVHRSVRLT